MPVTSPLPDIYLKDLSLNEYVFNALPKHGDSIAFIDATDNRKFTFRDVDRLSRKVASGFQAAGMQKGDVLLISLPNCAEFVIAELGALLLGAVISPINPTYTAGEIQRHLEQCDAKFAITNAENTDRLKEAVAAVGGAVKIYLVGSSFDALLKSVVNDAVPAVEIFPKLDVALLPSSSGTTGPPKCVMLTHGNVTAMLQLLTSPFYISPQKGDHFIGFLPFFHAFGHALMIMGMHQGCTTVMMRTYTGERLLQLIEQYKVEVLYAVPPIILFLAKDPLASKYDISSLKVVCSGAAPLGKALSVDLVTRHPSIKFLLQGYGMTECSVASHMCVPVPMSEMKHGTCGLLISNYECKVIDVETGAELGEDQSGEICVRSTTVMKGYLKRPAETKATVDDEGWLHTGDIGHYDEDGFFFITDRLKELIKVKGFQVAPAELEDILLSHPAVRDVAVIGKPDIISGEAPMGLVVLHEGYEKTTSSKELRAFVDSKVSAHKHLRGGIVFVDEIPKSPSGKILRRTLREQYASSTSKL